MEVEEEVDIKTWRYGYYVEKVKYLKKPIKLS